MAPISFKDMISVDYRPGEPEEIKYYAQKRRKQYHGNESKDIDELSMKSDKKLPNLKIPVKGKKGISKFMRKKAIGQAKDDLNASVQSADRKPEKYIKPDGKVGIRMVKTDKEVIKKEQMQVYRVGHKDMSGNVHATTPDDAMKKLRKKGLKGDIKLTHRGSARSMPVRRIPRREQTEAIKHTHAVVDPAGKVAGMTSNERDAKDIARRHKGKVIKLKKPMSPNRGDMMINRPFKEAINHSDAHRDAQTHSDGSMSVKKIPSMIKKPGDKHLHLHMKSYHKEKDGQDFAKKHGYKVKNYVKTQSGTRMDIHKESVDEAVRNLSAADQVKAALKIIRDKRFNMRSQIDKKTAIQKISKDLLKDPKVKKEMDKIYEENVEEALTLQQRMKRGRLMKRLKARIKIGRDRARRKMANKKTLEKRSMRQARNQLAKKLTRGIPKRELTFARKQEIEKRLEKPALKQRIKRIAKRLFKDVRKKEVQRKKG